ncbi:hypothetical protein KEN49_CDS0057 [Pseudomonas phage vB_Pae3705-KEN49]
MIKYLNALRYSLINPLPLLKLSPTWTIQSLLCSLISIN